MEVFPDVVCSQTQDAQQNGKREGDTPKTQKAVWLIKKSI